MRKHTHSEPCGQCGLSHHGESDISDYFAQKDAEAKVKKCYRENARAWDRVKTRAFIEGKLRDACGERVA